MKINDYKQKTLAGIIGLAVSVAIIVLSLLQLFNIWDNAINVFEPLVGILMLIQALENWKTNKAVAYFSLFVAIFVLIVSIIILF